MTELAGWMLPPRPKSPRTDSIMLSFTRKDLRYSPREAVDMAFSTLGWVMLSRANERQFELNVPRIFIERLHLNHIFDGKYEPL